MNYFLLIKKGIVLMVMSVFMFSVSYADEVKYNDSWGQQGYNLVTSEKTGVKIVHSVSSFNFIPVNIDGQEMFAVNMPGVFLPNDAGAPNLPGQGQFIAVPNGATAKLNIISQRTETFQNVEIAPAPPIPLESDDSPLVYEKNMTIYGQDAFYPASPVIISDLKNIRGVSTVMVGITPFQYNPVSKELQVIRDIEFEIVFEGGNGEFGDPRLRSRWWDPILSSSILNSQSLPEMDYTYVNPGVTENDEFEYIIITLNDPDFLDWANTIKEYREKQGITTGVVTTDDLGGNSVANIESYIDNAYNTWSTAPSAVLLLGDYGYGSAGIISHMYAHPASYPAFASDNKYADVNNDELPDVVLARITANNAEQLEVMISKFMDYETNPPTDPDFYNHPITALGWQTERWFQLCSEAVGGYFKNVQGKDPVRINAIYSGTPGSVWSTATNTSTVVNYFGPNGQGYIPAAPSSMGGWSGGTGTDVVNAINAGSFLLQHRDHGSYTGWGEPAFNSYSINNLQNVDNKLTFVFSINCQTGAFHNSSECFTEKFHRHTYNGENSGALGLLAATEVSYSFVNDTYLWGVIDNMFPDFMPDETTEFPVDYVMPAFGNAAGKHFLFESSWPYNTNNKQVTYRLFHHHGGAFLTLFTEVPSALTVAHDGIIPYGANTFALTTTPGALICLYKDGEILSTATGGFGQSIIPLPSSLAIGDEVTLTITKQNYVRYEEVLEVGELLSANFAADKDSTCAEGLVNFNDLTSGDPTEWLWTFEGGTPETSTAQHPQGIQYDTPGVYDVSLEVTSPNSSDIYTIEDYITVIENAEVSVEVTATALEICDGEEVTFVAEIDNGGETPVIQWKLNGNDVGDGTDTFVSSEFVNGDIVSCEVTSSIECTVENPVMAEEAVMIVNDILPVGVSIEANNDIICEGDEVIFTATPENGGNVPVYQWYVNGNPVGENSAEFAVSTLAQDDVVSCELTSNADCISGNPAMSNALNVDLHAYPEALEMPAGPNDIDVYETTSSNYSTSEEPGAIAYTWDVTPEEAYTAITPEMNNITVNWAEDYTGQVSISVFATNECGDGPVSDNFEVSVMNTFSINENELDVAVSVFPNPNNGSFTIKLTSNANENVKMQIRSILGEVVFTDEELNVNGELVKEVDLSKYAEGIYFLILENNNKVLTEKIVVQQ